LKHPETQEWEELVTFVVEAIVLASLDNSKQQKAGKPCAPEHYEKGSNNLASIVVA